MGTMSPRVSVVIPVFNGARTLADCLRGVAAQTLPAADFEVIVVDDGSTDATAAVASGFGTLLRQAHRGAASARNTGVRAAHGEWVAFTDADCIPTRGWLQALLAAVHAADGDGLGAAGRVVGYQSESAAARFVDLSGGLDAERHLAHATFPFAPSGNVMYRCAALQAAGGFDTRYAAYDACELHNRLRRLHGGPFRFEPRAVVLHRHRASWPAYWRQQFTYGRGYGQFLLHHRADIRWSMWRELRAWYDMALLGLAAARGGSDDHALLRRGELVKACAQRLGIITTYWNPRERRRW